MAEVKVKIDINKMLKESGMRLEVLTFSLEMERFMLENDKKKGERWKDKRVKELLDHLDIEFDELRWSIEDMDVEEVQKILIDVANYCMMSYAKLEKRKQED